MGMMKKTFKTGAGLAILAAAAGAYFLTGARGERNRPRLKGWMLKMKGDVVAGLKNIKDNKEITYHRLVDKAADKYRAFREANKEEFDALHKELKSAWRRIRPGQPKPAPKAVKRRAGPFKGRRDAS